MLGTVPVNDAVFSNVDISSKLREKFNCTIGFCAYALQF